ncbi:MAG: endopeptidase La [Alphaproteobacteria bacterium 16-39-46]|nr:MAG: endopeptidase La [Alphaproteobacteria bacterium 16-39-46]OZA41031.1 MAG: endopeptidase La [Alphaproteobacteria bacterium 17-39-52]HQS84994.1 endopeptidase La [Alphaproteobacteria bacterium]HQS94737.1 endopeptidase La [Alphaproteobacteria bacterium]
MIHSQKSVQEHHVPEIFPVLPLRDIVVYPSMIVPLFIGREHSIQTIERVMNEDKTLLLLTQKDSTVDAPTTDDLYTVGVFATVLQVLKLPDGTIKALVEGVGRASVLGFMTKEDGFEAFARPLEDILDPEQDLSPFIRVLKEEFSHYTKSNKKILPEVFATISKIEEAGKFSDMVSGHLILKIKDKQKILETPSVKKRLEMLLTFIEEEMSALETEQRIRNRIKRQVGKSQREYFLNEQMKAIQKELGEEEGGKSDFDKYDERIEKTKLSKEARLKAKSELKRLRTMSPMSAEAVILRTYLEWLLDLPWKKKSKEDIDINVAQSVLDKEHYGLEKVKERILEFMAVQKRVGKVGGQILCLVGPPGVGKTSLGKAIAEALGRKFVRMSLGGVRDEAEIRGHRRTYIGALPGRIIQGMKKAGTSNPLFLLDEIDKLGSDWRGDPTSALLEVLDPEQNSTFNDHYLEVDYDLSDVMFVTTANTLNMTQPLLDRMEVIRLHGYTEEEKIKIAETHLIPKQREKHGLQRQEFDITLEALKQVITFYTKEAGVRNLEREIASLARKVVKDILTSSKTHVTITPDVLESYLGVQKYRIGEAELKDLVGVTAGLAWTEVGGDTLIIEALRTSGKGKVISTGKLGVVMQESVQAALSYVRGRAEDFGIDPSLFEKSDIHVHFPEGAIPKDGPSAGVTIVTSLVSLFTQIPVRRDVAMTGEITLRGRILPIGGLKEKLLAAQRAGIKTVFIPKDNEKDLKEIPEAVKKALKICPVDTVDEILRGALTQKIKPRKMKKMDLEVPELTDIPFPNVTEFPEGTPLQY